MKKIEEILKIQFYYYVNNISKIQVRFYRKSEIIKFKPQAKPWISNNEVFSTSCNDYILASAILSPCRIVTLEEYEASSQVDKGIFFTRLEWLPTKKKFDGLSKLQNHCTCKQPQNPDQIYIQCDKCQKWYSQKSKVKQIFITFLQYLINFLFCFINQNRFAYLQKNQIRFPKYLYHITCVGLKKGEYEQKDYICGCCR